MRGVGAVLSIVAAVWLGLAAAAQAAPRYAAPAGTGSECTKETPCSLPQAVTAATGGDEVIVTPGSYTLVSPLNFPPVPGIQVHGEAGAAVPMISGAFGGPVLLMTQAGDGLADLEIEDNGNGGIGVYCLAAKVERVKARVVGSGTIGVIAASDCSIRNSLFRVEGPGAVGVRGLANLSGAESAVARGVTAIATGSASIGVSAEYESPSSGSFTMELQNTVAQGGEADLRATSGSKGPGIISATHSNFDKAMPVGEGKVIDGGGNQSAPPLFVDAENGDYREAAGSPTIDAGSSGELGPSDLAGSARIQGPAPDIGAYESFTPAPPVGAIQSLKLKPSSFKAGKGTTVTYVLSAAGAATFTVERKVAGRKAGKRCVKKTHANSAKPRCTLLKPVRGGIAEAGAAGSNSFRFSGKLGGRALKPGSYVLVGTAGGATRKAAFKILK